MPKGLKETSGVIVISANVAESAANTFTSQKVDLQLNALDREVFIVYAIDLDTEQPELITGTNTSARMSRLLTRRTWPSYISGIHLGRRDSRLLRQSSSAGQSQRF